MNHVRKDNRLRHLPVVAVVLLLSALLFGVTAPAALAQDGDGEGADSPFSSDVVTSTTRVNVNLRRGPGLDFDVIQVVPAGSVVGFTGFMDGTGNWVQVDPVGAPVGWMHASLLESVPDGLQIRPADLPEEEQEAEVDFAPNVATGTTEFNVYLRSSPSQSFNIIEVVPAGTTVGYTGFTDGSGNWVQVDPAGAPLGWIWGEFLTNVPEELQVRPADRPDDAAAEPTPAVTVADQELGNGDTVTVPQVTATEAGWLVIHVNDNGAPGAVIGQTAVEAGTNENVMVEVDAQEVTETLFAMLHVDAGESGVYEFPGPDVPVQVDGDVVVRPFQLTEFAEFPANVVTTTTLFNVNLRTGPGLSFEIIQVVPRGTVVGFTGFMDETGNWVQVDPVGAPVGWMHASLLESVPDGLSVAE